MQPVTVPFDAGKIRKKDQQLWDPARKQWVAHTPEEWVRQLWVQYWMAQGVPASRLSVEKGLRVNGQYKRTDVVVYNSMHQPWLLLECKAPDVALNQKVFDQIARYNLTLKVPYLVVSNGHFTLAAQIDYTNRSYQLLDTMPAMDST